MGVACAWCGRGDARRVDVEVFSDDRSDIHTVHLCNVCRHLMEPPPSKAVLAAIVEASRERESGFGRTDHVTWPDERHHTRDRRETDRRESDRRRSDRRSA